MEPAEAEPRPAEWLSIFPRRLLKRLHLHLRAKWVVAEDDVFEDLLKPRTRIVPRPTVKKVTSHVKTHDEVTKASSHIAIGIGLLQRSKSLIKTC